MRRNKQSVQSAILRPHGSKLTGISIGWRVHWSSKTIAVFQPFLNIRLLPLRHATS